MRRLALITLIGAAGLVSIEAVAQPAPNGETIYLANCARCHETAIPLMPDRDALKAMDLGRIENALSTWSMRFVGEGLTHAERRAVAEYLTGMPAGSFKAPLELMPESAFCSNNTNVANPLAGPSWNGWSPGTTNTRYNAEPGLASGEVPRLKLKWAFGVPGTGSSGSQTTVIGNRVFVGARNGMLFSLDRETGCIAWAFEADGGIRSTPVVATDDGTVFVGDAFANVYALDALTGSLHWRAKLDDHVHAMITGGASYHDGRLYVPVSSIEEGGAAVPGYECCTFRGSLVALDAKDGREVWRMRTIAKGAEPTGTNSAGTRTWGPSGVAIWSAPTIDPAHNRIYVTTGDNYTQPTVATSDAIMALALDTGEVIWAEQTMPNDAWNLSCAAGGDAAVNCPEDAGPDADFGSSSALVELADGSSILVAGQKSGVVYALDPVSGKLRWERRVGDGGVLGGIEWGLATDGKAAYVAISEAYEKAAGEAGSLSAVDLADGRILWKTPASKTSCENRNGCNTGQPGAVSAIPGVVFAGSLDGHLRAYDAKTGNVVWDFDTVRQYDTVNGVPAHGGSLSGPGATVAGGMVFVSSGYASFDFMPGNALLAFAPD